MPADRVREIAVLASYSLLGRSLSRPLRELRKYNALSRSDMTELQCRQLTALLNWLFCNNDHYREVLSRIGFQLGDQFDVASLTKLPLLTKEFIKRHGERLESRGIRPGFSRKTSGSTGSPMVIRKDPRALAYMDAVMYDCYSWHGIAIGSRHGRIWGTPLDGRGRIPSNLKDLFLRRAGLSSFDLTADSCRSYYLKLLKFRPIYLYGIVSAVREFARQLASTGLEGGSLNLKAVITTGEILFPQDRHFLREIFKTSIVNEYGCTECGIVAFECPFGYMHLTGHNLVVEIVDPETHLPQSPGVVGEVVMTELQSRLMPLIRYAIGDRASLSSARCPCGRELPLIEELQGRESDLIVLPSGRRVAATLIAYSMPQYIAHFQCVQSNLDRLEILFTSDIVVSRAMSEAISVNLRKVLGDDMRISLEQTGSLSRERAGKLFYFVSRLPKEHRAS